MEILFGRNQFAVFLSFLVCGVLAGIVFDALKVKRHLFGAPNAVLFVDDFIFMLLCGILLIFNAFAFNDGNFKWYEVPFMLAGFTVYRLTLSRLVIFVFFGAIDVAKKLLKRLLRPILRLLCKGVAVISVLFWHFRCNAAVHRLKIRLQNNYPLLE